MRNISKLLEEMIDVIPQEEYQLRGRLQSVHESAFYTPPESMYFRFWEVSEILAQELGGDKIRENTWQSTLLKIWTF